MERLTGSAHTLTRATQSHKCRSLRTHRGQPFAARSPLLSACRLPRGISHRGRPCRRYAIASPGRRYCAQGSRRKTHRRL